MGLTLFKFLNFHIFNCSYVLGSGGIGGKVEGIGVGAAGGGEAASGAAGGCSGEGVLVGVVSFFSAGASPADTAILHSLVPASTVAPSST